MLTLVTGKEINRDPSKTYFTKKSPLTQVVHTAEFNMDHKEFTARYNAWASRSALIQHAFDNLNEDEREFIMTGYTPDDWNRMFPDTDEQESADVSQL